MDEVNNMKPNKGDIRHDGKRYDGYTWRDVGVNHHMNSNGLVYYKRKFRTLDGYLRQGGNIKKIKHNAPDVSEIGKVVTLLYDQQKTGHVYAISNPAWGEWVKIGMAVDAEDRCNAYQTSSPLRDYKLIHSIFVKDRRLAELEAHATIQKMGYDRRGEWFKVDIPTVKLILDKILKGD